MAQFDLQGAEAIYNDQHELIGYVRQHTPDLWLPLDMNRENISGPTYKADAITIVNLAATGKI
jgi:hypothetical protein